MTGVYPPPAPRSYRLIADKVRPQVILARIFQPGRLAGAVTERGQEERMPLVKVWLREPVDDVRTGSILDGIHQALVTEANVPSDDRFQVVERLSESRMIAHPSYGGVERSEQLVFVEITLNRGRSVEVKKRLYAAIARNLEKEPGIRSDDLLISLVEVEKENWSFGKGIATYAE